MFIEVFTNWYKNKMLAKYHVSCKTITALDWERIHEKKTFEPLLKRGKLDSYALQAYELVSDSIIDEFGTSDNFKLYLAKKSKIELMYLKQQETGDFSSSLLIEVQEAELEKLKKVEGKSDVWRSILSIEKNMGVKINGSITLFEFYQYSKFLSQ